MSTIWQELIILKLDFEKAIDMIEHKAIRELLVGRCAGPKWLMWMDMILASGNFPVVLMEFLVNSSSATKELGARVGGVPLSPLLFVIVADLLQSILNEALTQNLIQGPIMSASCKDFLVIQYDDDSILIMQGCSAQSN